MAKDDSSLVKIKEDIIKNLKGLSLHEAKMVLKYVSDSLESLAILME